MDAWLQKTSIRQIWSSITVHIGIHIVGRVYAKGTVVKNVFYKNISWLVAAIACIFLLLIVMVARIVTQKRQGLAPTSFFISSPLSLFVVQGISRYHTIFRPLLLCKKSNNGSQASYIAYVSRPPACWAIALVIQRLPCTVKVCWEIFERKLVVYIQGNEIYPQYYSL